MAVAAVPLAFDARRTLAAAVVVLIAGACSDAAGPQGPVQETGTREPQRRASDDPRLPVGTSYLAQEYGISEPEAQRRQRNDEHVSALARSLRLKPTAGFSDLWIEHEPYAVKIAFKGRPDREAVLARAHPELRRDIVFVSAKRDRAGIERDIDRVNDAFRKLSGQWSGGYDVRTEKFEYKVMTPADRAAAESYLPPDLKGDVTISVGGVPQPLGR